MLSTSLQNIIMNLTFENSTHVTSASCPCNDAIGFLPKWELCRVVFQIYAELSLLPLTRYLLKSLGILIIIHVLTNYQILNHFYMLNRNNMYELIPIIGA